MIEVGSLKELREAGFTRVSLACGNFDGVHFGHQSIIGKLQQVAAASDAAPVVLTFFPHPRQVLQGIKVPSLTSPAVKKELMAEFGVQALVTIPFCRDFAAIPATDFVNRVLQVDGLEVCDLCIGSLWKFGAGRKGDVEFMKNGPWSFKVHALQEVYQDGETVSSSRIRTALAAGDFEKAASLLGREYSVSGPVVHGRGIASSKLKFATANIQVNECLPVAGVLACMARIENEIEWRPAICNIGVAPTFHGEFVQAARVELHLFDFNEDLYDKNIELVFKKFIRPEQRFSGIDKLKEQIAKDVAEARNILASV